MGACAALGITNQDALSKDLEKSYTAIPNNIRRQAKMLTFGILRTEKTILYSL